MKKIIYAYLIVIVLTAIGAALKILNSSYANELLVFSMVSALILNIIFIIWCIIDMTKSNIPNKSLWLIGILFFTFPVAFLYIGMRRKYVRK